LSCLPWLLGFSVLVELPGSAVSAQGVYQAASGTRPLGMGETFTAIADDGNAVRWNPAGLPSLQRHELTSMYSDLFGLGFTNGYLGYTLPVFDNHAIGFDWFHSGFNDNELMFRREVVSFAYGYRLANYLSLGLSAKYVNMEMGLDNRSLGNASGFGLDLGLIARPTAWLRLGMTAHDISGTGVKYDTDVYEKIFKQRLRFGLALYPVDGLTVGADVDDRIHTGVEYWLFDLIGIRLGFQKDLETYGRPLGSTTHYSAGFSVRYKFLRFDYAFVHNPVLPGTQYFSVSFLSTPSFVTIKEARIRQSPIFRSLYRSYEGSPFVELTVKNAAQEELPATVQVKIPTLIDQPYEERIVLKPQSTDNYTVRVAFPENILQSDRSAFDNLVQPTVRISYIQGRQRKQTTGPVSSVYVLGRNKISWSDPRRAVSFITPEDPAVDAFSRGVILQYKDVLQKNFNNSNIGKALLLFDNLGALGIQYNPDQTTPFNKVAGEKSAFDTIKFPGEMLHAKIGDCDDLTVLYAALLQNLGIKTALLDVDAPGEGHIYLMFDSGIPPDNVARNFVDESEYVQWNGTIWIPVEVTMVGRSFYDAWRNGASEYHRRKAEGYIHEIDVLQAQATYRPGVFNSQPVDLPSAEAVAELLNRDIEAFDVRLQEMTLAAGISLDTPEGLYEAGATFLSHNLNDRAEEFLNKALKLKPDMADAINALGVIATRKGDYGRALELYQKAAALNPSDGGIQLNIAITYYLMGRRVEARQAYRRAVEIDPSLEGQLPFLE